MTVTAIIPARAGSKAVPQKNLRALGGRPLVNWTIDAARGASLVDRVVVSTDDEEIAEVAKAAGAEVPFIRPSNLAADDVHSIHTVFHALDWFQNTEDGLPDVIIMLLPTSPFRRADHIDGALRLFLDLEPPAVIAVCLHDKPLVSLRWIRDGAMVPVARPAGPFDQRQDVEPVYAVNGAIYVSNPESIRRNQSFHVDGAVPYEMPMLNSLDINTPVDFELAEILAERLAGNPSA